MGDHGMTMHGDHGGGTPEEVCASTHLLQKLFFDSLRFGFQSIRRWKSGRASPPQRLREDGLPYPAVASRTNLLPWVCFRGGGVPLTLGCAFAQTDSALFAYSPRVHQPHTNPAAVSEMLQRHKGSGAWCPECTGTMPQVDLAPTLAALLGVPIPFGRCAAQPLIAQPLIDIAATPTTHSHSTSLYFQRL
jgi:hypothetical protein